MSPLAIILYPHEQVEHAGTEDDVRAHAKANLAGYKRPQYVVFADELPKNPSGKILKRDLREKHADLAKTDS